MDLTDSIKKASEQQPARNIQNAKNIKKAVDLGTGRIPCYKYNGSGRPTNESCENVKSDGQIMNE